MQPPHLQINDNFNSSGPNKITRHNGNDAQYQQNVDDDTSKNDSATLEIALKTSVMPKSTSEDEGNHMDHHDTLVDDVMQYLKNLASQGYYYGNGRTLATPTKSHTAGRIRYNCSLHRKRVHTKDPLCKETLYLIKYRTIRKWGIRHVGTHNHEPLNERQAPQRLEQSMRTLQEEINRLERDCSRSAIGQYAVVSPAAISIRPGAAVGASHQTMRMRAVPILPSVPSVQQPTPKKSTPQLLPPSALDANSSAAPNTLPIWKKNPPAEQYKPSPKTIRKVPPPPMPKPRSLVKLAPRPDVYDKTGTAVEVSSNSKSTRTTVKKSSTSPTTSIDDISMQQATQSAAQAVVKCMKTKKVAAKTITPTKATTTIASYTPVTKTTTPPMANTNLTTLTTAEASTKSITNTTKISVLSHVPITPSNTQSQPVTTKRAAISIRNVLSAPQSKMSAQLQVAPATKNIHNPIISTDVPITSLQPSIPQSDQAAVYFAPSPSPVPTSIPVPVVLPGSVSVPVPVSSPVPAMPSTSPISAVPTSLPAIPAGAPRTLPAYRKLTVIRPRPALTPPPDATVPLHVICKEKNEKIPTKSNGNGSSLKRNLDKGGDEIGNPVTTKPKLSKRPRAQSKTDEEEEEEHDDDDKDDDVEGGEDQGIDTLSYGESLAIFNECYRLAVENGATEWLYDRLKEVCDVLQSGQLPEMSWKVEKGSSITKKKKKKIGRKSTCENDHAVVGGPRISKKKRAVMTSLDVAISSRGNEGVAVRP